MVGDAHPVRVSVLSFLVREVRPNTTLIFQSKKDTGDYHDEMTGEHFEEWFRDRVLPNVSPHSLIVMDNASYHSRIEEEMPKKVQNV